MPPLSKRPRLANAPANRGLFNLAVAPQEQLSKPEATTDTSPAGAQRHFSDRKFKDAPISKESKAAIKHEYLSDVQAATLDLALNGKDLLVQAKTGTGKTIAFLLPAIERLIKSPTPVRGISILVLSPTRELALQIEDEAKVLLKNHPFKVQHAIGGTNINTEKNRIAFSPCDILIATPGRLLDHLQNNSLAPQFTHMRTIVYDEADRLLDQGFKKELDSILTFLPDKRKFPRQALLFSATVSKEVKQIAASALRADYTFVSTLLEDELNTHEHVKQSFIIVPFSAALPTTLAILRQDLADHTPKGANLTHSTSKCMVFFPTARHVSFAQELLSNITGLPKLYDIHSRKSQSARTKAAENFRDAKSAILLSSDVAARGMDFPGVTLVLQVGLPADGDQYIHRLGRTARAGAAGRGIIILSPAEQVFLSSKTIRDLPITAHQPAPSQVSLAPFAHEISAVLGKVSDETKESAYRAWLGYYNGSTKDMKWSKEQLVREGWDYAVQSLGWTGSVPPSIEPKTVGKMGLRGVPGLNISSARGGGGGVRGGGALRGRGQRY